MKQYYNFDDSTYGNVERLFATLGCEVLHLMRDTREDWGDDGGYMVAIYRQNGKVCVAVLPINYNDEVNIYILTDEQAANFADQPELIDFVEVESVEKAQEWINAFVDDLIQKLKDADGKRYDVEFEEGTQYGMFIEAVIFSFSEYVEKDSALLRNLSSTPYVQNFLDEGIYDDDEAVVDDVFLEIDEE